MAVDNAYRRGTLLGLTIAEIFILLIFLILLALLGLASHWEEKEKGYIAAREAAHARERRREKVLSEWRDVIEFHTPKEIKTLHSRIAAIQQQIDQYEDWINREHFDGQAELGKLLKEKEWLRRENQALDDKNEAIRAEREKLQSDNERLSEERKSLHEQAETEKRNADQARKELSVLRKKGENPPCWYKTVAAGPGKTRERAYYIFDIAVYDDAMVVRHRQPPPGRAEDDDGPLYADEALSLSRITYNTRLTDTELVEQMRPLHDLGKAGKVRSYPCIFSVMVWDKTSPHAKARWKRAHDNILEALFGTYNVKDDPWPESPPNSRETDLGQR